MKGVLMEGGSTKGCCGGCGGVTAATTMGLGLGGGRFGIVGGAGSLGSHYSTPFLMLPPFLVYFPIPLC